MSDLSTQLLFEQYKACVLIPTYNNAGTLAAIIKDVQAYTDHIVVVNDGATDGTDDILQQFSDIHVVAYTPNKGKGYALREGFKETARLGYEYAITIDSDGQHYASDLPLFLEQLVHTPHALIIGARNMHQENVPGKSSFGNRFSNFWYWVETGNKLHDTQSGYRLYPLNKVAHKTYFTRKYEFEIEVIIRAAWSGVPVINIPVSVYYPPAGERISHFRPFKDFTRISILNTVLVLIALLWIKPRDFTKLLFSKAGWRKMWKMAFANPEESVHRKAASIAFGIFMGIVPIWGFQLLVGISLAVLMRLNKALFVIAAHISVFPITPVIWVASIMTGKLVMGDKVLIIDPRHLTLTEVKNAGIAFFLGGTVLAIVAGIVAYIISYSGLLLSRRNKLK